MSRTHKTARSDAWFDALLLLPAPFLTLYLVVAAVAKAVG